MRDIIIETDAMTRFNTAVDEVMEGDKDLSGFIISIGQAGRGKTVAADSYYTNRGGVYVRVQQGWSQTAFMQRLLFEVRGKNDADMPKSNVHRCKQEIIDILEKDRKPLFFDEADRLPVNIIEHIRDIADITGVPPVLIGEEGLNGLLRERRRIWSRVVEEVEFGPISAGEIAVYAMQAAGLDIPAELCIKIKDKAEGDFRLVRNMTRLLERAAKAADTVKVNKDILETVLSARSWRRG